MGRKVFYDLITVKLPIGRATVAANRITDFFSKDERFTLRYETEAETDRPYCSVFQDTSNSLLVICACEGEGWSNEHEANSRFMVEMYESNRDPNPLSPSIRADVRKNLALIIRNVRSLTEQELSKEDRFIRN